MTGPWIASFLVSVVAVGIALWAQWSVRRERRSVFELDILTRIVEHYSLGNAGYAGENIVSRLVATLPDDDLPTLRAWLADPVARSTYEMVEPTILSEYREAVRRRM